MRPALLLIDFINDIVHPEGKSPSCAKFIKDYQVHQKANNVITFARKQQIPIILIKVGFLHHEAQISTHSKLFSKAREHKIFSLNTWGTEFHADLSACQNDLTLVKTRISAFHGTSLESILRVLERDSVILAGCSTSMAIQSTARDAHDRDFQVFIIEDACGDRDIESHNASLKTISLIAKTVNSTSIDNILL
jgi:nicotinamidase-related amidase